MFVMMALLHRPRVERALGSIVHTDGERICKV